MHQTPQRVYVDISWRALLKIVVLVASIFAFVVLRDIVTMLLAVFILVAALNPTVMKLQQHMSRPLAVVLIYVILLLVFLGISSLLIPSFIRQLNDLIGAFPTITDHLRSTFRDLQINGKSQLINQAMGSLGSTLSSLPGSFLQSTYGFFGSLVTFATGFVISFYLLLEEKNAKDFFYQILPQHRYEVVYQTVSKISNRMGSWVRGQLFLMLFIGVCNFIIYLLIGVRTPLPFALWAGLCELIPMIGPLIGVLPAIVVSLTAGLFLQALLVFLFGYLLLQQVEVHFVLPRVLGRAVGLSPVLVIIALLIGAKLLGLLGALLAVPTAAVISVIVGEWPSLRQLWEVNSQV